jgi:hypothetical protein
MFEIFLILNSPDFCMDKREPSPLRGEGRERVFDE